MKKLHILLKTYVIFNNICRYRFYESFLITPYEMVSKVAIPTIRSMISKRLIDSYNLTQEEVAKKLDITQAAVSYYMMGKRATMLKLDNTKAIRDSIDELADLLFIGDISHKDFRERITDICDNIRESKLLCKLHKRLEPGLDMANCHACDGPLKRRSESASYIA